MIKHHFTLFADYFQFYLQDEESNGIDGDSWTKLASEQRLALEVGAFAVTTARNMEVPVEVLILESQPELDLSRWDHVVEFSFTVRSGRLVVAGCTDYWPEAARINLVPGHYRVRVSQGLLDHLSYDQLEGEDHYLVELWKGDAIPIRVLKQYVET